MNLGGGQIMTPDGAKLTLLDGREYTADHVVICNQMEMSDERWLPKHVATCKGSRGRVLRTDDQGPPVPWLWSTCGDQNSIYIFSPTNQDPEHPYAGNVCIRTSSIVSDLVTDIAPPAPQHPRTTAMSRL